MTFIGLNPSTANEAVDDPTIRRCAAFAAQWGFARLNVVNLYAFCSTDPRLLFAAEDPVGPENDRILVETSASSDAVVAAWGAHADPKRAALVLEWIHMPSCLGTTRNGAPRHPLYVRKDACLVPLASAADAVLGS